MNSAIHHPGDSIPTSSSLVLCCIHVCMSGSVRMDLQSMETIIHCNSIEESELDLLDHGIIVVSLLHVFRGRNPTRGRAALVFAVAVVAILLVGAGPLLKDVTATQEETANAPREHVFYGFGGIIIVFVIVFAVLFVVAPQVRVQIVVLPNEHSVHVLPGVEQLQIVVVAISFHVLVRFLLSLLLKFHHLVESIRSMLLL
mmetsp:Transcript_26988/g.74195  ORF Transcript_26988/g.74195 Transcript_26988/m.74195 type:complete len:200 (-) Transcript_26988:93-692(-)